MTNTSKELDQVNDGITKNFNILIEDYSYEPNLVELAVEFTTDYMAVEDLSGIITQYDRRARDPEEYSSLGEYIHIVRGIELFLPNSSERSTMKHVAGIVLEAEIRQAHGILDGSITFSDNQDKESVAHRHLFKAIHAINFLYDFSEKGRALRQGEYKQEIFGEKPEISDEVTQTPEELWTLFDVTRDAADLVLEEDVGDDSDDSFVRSMKRNMLMQDVDSAVGGEGSIDLGELFIDIDTINRNLEPNHQIPNMAKWIIGEAGRYFMYKAHRILKQNPVVAIEYLDNVIATFDMQTQLREERVPNTILPPTR